MAPADIAGTVTLEDGNQSPFFPQQQLNRPGLALANGSVYIAFGSSCDRVPGGVHGWLFAYDARSLQPRAIFNTTSTSANTYLGAIWQSTFAPSVDERGNVYVATGNGTFDANAGHSSYAESILRLDPTLHVRDYFTPRRVADLTIHDQDVGSTGVMLIPNQATPGHRLALSGEKDGFVFLLDRDHLGGYNASRDAVLQTIPLEPMDNALYGGPAYFDGRLYWGATEQPMVSGVLSMTGGPHVVAASRTENTFPGEGGVIPAVSSDGTRPGSAVVWATTRVPNGSTFRLFAYDAFDLRKTLFSGSVGPWLSMGDAFLTPTIAGGHVFVPGAGNGVAEFGLK